MDNALNSLTEERRDELSSVMIDLGEVKLKQLLGKGGNGEVHIAQVSKSAG